MNISGDNVKIYDSAQRANPPLDELREAVNYRNLIMQLIRRDVLTRYKRSVLGVAWTLLNPLGMMLVITLAFSQIFRFATEYSYAGYVLTGLLAWNFFAQTTTACMVNLVWGGGLLNRIYIPRASFALAAIGTGLVNLTLATLPLLVVMMITRIPIKPAILFLPIPMLLMAGFSLGLGLLISTAAVYFPDVSEMYQIILMGWFYLTPIIYPVEVLPEPLGFWILHLNPVYYIVNLYRIPTYYGRLPIWEEFMPPFLISVVILFVGWWFFSRKADEFAYRI
jgi:ABC-2 type transport system permease protein